MRNKIGLVCLSWLVCLTWNAVVFSDDPPKLPLRVLYLARDNDEAREEAFTEFLTANFVQSSVVKRSDFQPETADQFDVVLLDWSQSEVVRPADFNAPRDYPSPLGERADWTVPTVLLGSAGQILAGPWETIGGAG